jgi:tetratricopeptide (TPR) repeat protein
VIAERYRIQRELGRGGNAVVYLAEDVKHDRLVALKVVVHELAESVCKDRFLREIQIAAKFAHPHIVPLYDSGEADGTLYYVMPYITGESLRDWLLRERQLPLEEALRITREVASALTYAHLERVVHRDIKITHGSRAAEIDPLSAVVFTNYAALLSYARQYKAAGVQARKALELEPSSAEGHMRLGDSYLHLGMFADAIREFQNARSLLGNRGRVAPVGMRLGLAYARSGRRGEALQILEELKAAEAKGENATSGYALNLAYLHAELGEKDQAFALLERAYQEHEHVLTNLKVNPLVDPLRSDPRFQPLLKKVGLEE